MQGGAWIPRFIRLLESGDLEENGGKRDSQVVVEKALDILATHQPDRLSPDAMERLDGIIEKAAERPTDKQLSV